VKKPAAKTAPRKPVEPAPAEKIDQDKAAAAAAATAAGDQGTPPPSGGDVAGPTAPSTGDANPAQAQPPPVSPLDTTDARSFVPAGEEEPAKRATGAGTWVVLATLVLGIAYIVTLTVRRRRDDDLSIFDRSAPRAPRPPIAHHT
jgi:hypothetical protein